MAMPLGFGLTRDRGLFMATRVEMLAEVLAKIAVLKRIQTSSEKPVTRELARNLAEAFAWLEARPVAWRKPDDQVEVARG